MPPMYEWYCKTCHENLEVFRSYEDYRVPPEHLHPLTRIISAPMVMPDLPSYKALTGDRAGQEVRGRKDHKEFLKRNRLIELGDSPIRPTSKFREVHHKGEIREELRKVVGSVCVSDIKHGGLKERYSR